MANTYYHADGTSALSDDGASWRPTRAISRCLNVRGYCSLRQKPRWACSDGSVPTSVPKHWGVIQPADNPTKNTENFGLIIANNSYFKTDLGEFRLQLDLTHAEPVQICGMIVADCKVVNIARSDWTLVGTRSENCIGICRAFLQQRVGWSVWGGALSRPPCQWLVKDPSRSCRTLRSCNWQYWLWPTQPYWMLRTTGYEETKNYGVAARP